MPRPPRRAAQQPRDTTATTPTRPMTTNAITAAIPPFMLETPPHAPFVTTPVPPSHNPAPGIASDSHGSRGRNARHPPQTPTASGGVQEHTAEQSHTSTQALGSTASDAGQGDEQSLLESAPHDPNDAKQLVGLREISSLATWTLSSSKPGCALAQLRHPSPSYFWQSDGPQPHTLTLHFFKLVAIVKLRIYLDFELDESYTPTKMKFFAGMSEGGLVEFGSWEVQESTDPETGEVHSGVEGIRGWIDVSLKGVGGRDTRHRGAAEGLGALRRTWASGGDEATTDDIASPKRLGKSRVGLVEGVDSGSADLVGGDVLKAMVVQVSICENHQNGKDTHVRGFQVFARDENAANGVRREVKSKRGQATVTDEDIEESVRSVGLEPAEWMRDPEIR